MNYFNAFLVKQYHSVMRTGYHMNLVDLCVPRGLSKAGNIVQFIMYIPA